MDIHEVIGDSVTVDARSIKQHLKCLNVIALKNKMVKQVAPARKCCRVSQNKPFFFFVILTNKVISGVCMTSMLLKVHAGVLAKQPQVERITLTAPEIANSE